MPTHVEIRDLLKSRRFSSMREGELHAEMATLFEEYGLPFQREVELTGAIRAPHLHSRYRDDSIFLCDQSHVARRRAQLRGVPARQHGDRIDFMVGRIGIEVKTQHSRTEVIRQLWRYAKSEKLDELMLVTTRSAHRDCPAEIEGKRVTLVYLCPL